MAPAERTALLRGMSDEGAAACLAAMSLPARTAVLADLAAADPTLATCALAFIWCAADTGRLWISIVLGQASLVQAQIMSVI